MVSDDHEGIKAAVRGELPGVEWQRCVVHTIRTQSTFGRCHGTLEFHSGPYKGMMWRISKVSSPTIMRSIKSCKMDCFSSKVASIVEPGVDPPAEGFERMLCSPGAPP